MSLSEQSITTATTTANDGGERPSKKQKVEEILACAACTDELDANGDYLTPCLDKACDQKFCYDCAKELFEVALNNGGQFPPKCCRRAYYTGIAEDVLSADDYQRYKARLEERMVPNPLYCAVPTCSEFIARRLYKKEDGKVACPKCASEVCTRCKNAAIQGHECNNKEIDAWLKKFGYKRCPRCTTGIIKLYGCEHVQCTCCGYHWCWVCRRKITVCQEEGCTGEDEAETEAADDQPVAPEPVVTNPGNAAATTGALTGTYGNLDTTEHNWEAEDLDLNEEPDTNNPDDIFDCPHEFTSFQINDVPDKWLKGLDKSKGVKLECMMCSKASFVPPRKKTRSKEKPAVMYKCTECGLLACLDCKIKHQPYYAAEP